MRMKGQLLKTHKYKSKKYHNSFTGKINFFLKKIVSFTFLLLDINKQTNKQMNNKGSEAVSWLLRNQICETTEEGIIFCFVLFCFTFN